MKILGTASPILQVLSVYFKIDIIFQFSYFNSHYGFYRHALQNHYEL